MTQAEFQSMMAARGCRVLGNGAFGVYRGYPYSAQITPAKRALVKLDFKVEGKADKALVKRLKGEVPKYCTPAAQNGRDSTLFINVQERDDDLERRILACLDAAVDAMQEAGLRPAETCPLCGSGGCDATGYAGGYVNVHRACVENQTQLTARRVEDNRLNGSYFTGILGALLGGLVGAIPAVLMREYGSYLVAVLYALVPLGANYGYRLFKGKRTKAAFFITIVFSVLDMFLMRIGAYAVYAVMHYGSYLSGVSDVVEAYFQSYGAAQIGPDLLFLALGLWIAWGSIRRTGAHEVQEAVMVAQTLLPERAPAAGGLDTRLEED